MNPDHKEAIRLLGAYTAGRFDVWMLAGNPQASCRAHIMSVFNGKRTPQSKAGVTAMRDAFYSVANPEGGCMAEIEDNFILWCRQNNC